MKRHFIIFSILILLLPVKSGILGAAQDTCPKLALMFASPQDNLTPEKISRYDLIIDGGLLESIGNYQIDYVRNLNPDLITLYPLQTEYVNYQAPILQDPGFQENYLVHYLNSLSACDSSSRFEQDWEFPIYSWNFVDDEAVRFRAEYVIRKFHELQDEDPDRYDGIHLDGTHLQPFFYIQNPDSLFDIDCDGDSDYFDSLDYIKPIWRQNVINFLTIIRNGLPDIVILCNDAKSYSEDMNILAPLINGVESELDISFFMDNLYNTNWYTDIFIPINQWNTESLKPKASLSISLYSSIPLFNPTNEQIEAGKNDYQRMRFGLVTSLMTNTHYLYDLSTNYVGKSLYWYDEYDNAGTQEPGYLGYPLNDAYCIDTLTTPNLLSNGSFENGLTNWQEEDVNGKGSIQLDNSTFVDGNYSVKASLNVIPQFDYQFQLKQTGVHINADSIYTLSFWAKAASPRKIIIMIHKDTSPWTIYCNGSSIDLTTDWKYISYTFKVPGTANPMPSDTRFTFILGADLHSVWIDDVKIKKGTSGTFRRDFENGIALCNTTNQYKHVTLNGTFYHIKGTQDPIVNNGQPCSEITLNPADGIILLNQKTPEQPNMWISADSLFAINNDSLELEITNNGGSDLTYSISTMNLINNHSFEQGLNYWEEEDHLNYGSMQCDNSTSIDGAASLKASLFSLPDYLYQFQLRQTGLQISADSLYTVSFWAKAEAPRLISIDILKHSSPWTSYCNGYIDAYLTPEWQYFKSTFKVLHDVNPVPDDTRFTFYLGASTPAVWIDYIKVYPGDTTNDWLYITPTSGIIPAGNSESIRLYTDISDLENGTYYTKIMLGSNDPDNPVVYIPVKLSVMSTDCPDNIDNNVPKNYELKQNYPNPFNPVTTIKYAIVRQEKVILCIYNIQGQLVKTLINEERQAGHHQVNWNGRDEGNNDVSSGIYVYILKTEHGYTRTKRMVLIR